MVVIPISLLVKAFFFKKASHFISRKLNDCALMASQMAIVSRTHCQGAWLEQQFTFRGEAAQCWHVPQLWIWLLPVGMYVHSWFFPNLDSAGKKRLCWYPAIMKLAWLNCLLTVIFLLDFIKTPSVANTADKESNPETFPDWE